MNKKPIYSMIAVLMIPLIGTMILPVSAWSYGDPAKADDLKYEKFGPRADRLFIKLYESQTGEWDTGLETGEIDVTDWPLDSEHYDRYTTLPWSDTVKVMGYGPEFDIYLFDLNNNGNQYLGNPPNPACPNPVYPNPMSNVALRKAVAYLTNRNKYIAQGIGAPMATAMYTPVGPAYSKYAHPDILPGGAREDLCYLYSRVDANATLDAGGFPLGLDGWRYWDRNGNSVKDAGEDFALKIVVRSDDGNRQYAGFDIIVELDNCRVHTTLFDLNSCDARTQVMSNKDFHIYTGGWSLNVDPDFLILWNWDFYWHPGNPYNYGGCNDPDFNVASYGVMYANDQLEAVSYSHAACLAYTTNVLSVPLWAYNGFKAVKRAYTGPGVAGVEEVYEGDYWKGFVNIPGYGVDNTDTFNNMYPEGHEFGGTGNNMTIRYGKVTDVGDLNPLYAIRPGDNKIIDLIGYDSLLRRDPYNLGQFMPWVALNYTVGLYTHPAYGTCTKCVFTLRPGVEWSDGTPVTLADIFFTFVEMDDILIGRGLPPPWWYSNVMNILGFKQFDPLNFEVLLDVKSVFAVGWIGLNRILPKHIWKPICTSGDPTTFAPDPNLINSGAWRLVEYWPDSHMLLYANTPNTAVDNNLSGSTPVTSDMGYFRFYPELSAIYTDGQNYKYDEALKTLDIAIQNEKQTNVTGVSGTVTVTCPNATVITIPLASTTIPSVSLNETLRSIKFTYGLWKIHIDITWNSIRPADKTCPITDQPYKWHWDKTMFWITITEDIAGSTWYDDAGPASYPYKTELVTPDFKVDIKDVARAQAAFGSYPGHPKWNTVADITGDYKIDIKDLSLISGRFGWHL